MPTGILTADFLTPDTALYAVEAEIGSSIVEGSIFEASYSVGIYSYTHMQWWPDGSYTGVQQNTLEMDKLFVWPANINAGIIAQDKNYDIFSWNTKRYDVTVNDITLGAGLDNITFDTAPPVTLYSQCVITTEATIDSEGQPTLAGDIAFEFLDGVLYVYRYVAVTGTRAFLWVYMPSWPYREIDIWSSNIIEFFDGTEARKELVSSYKMKFEYPLELFGAQAIAMFLQKVRGAQQHTIVHPCWISLSTLTQNTSSISTDVHCVTTNRDFIVGGQMLLLNNAGGVEVLTISEIYSDHLVTTTAPQGTFIIGDYVLPARVCTLRTAEPLSMQSGLYATHNIVVEEL